jgi:hypothetical protein
MDQRLRDAFDRTANRAFERWNGELHRPVAAVARWNVRNEQREVRRPLAGAMFDFFQRRCDPSGRCATISVRYGSPSACRSPFRGAGGGVALDTGHVKPFAAGQFGRLLPWTIRKLVRRPPASRARGRRRARSCDAWKREARGEAPDGSSRRPLQAIALASRAAEETCVARPQRARCGRHSGARVWAKASAGSATPSPRR